MGAFLEKPNTNKHNENGEGNGLRFGVSSMQGKYSFLNNKMQLFIDFFCVRMAL